MRMMSGWLLAAFVLVTGPSFSAPFPAVGFDETLAGESDLAVILAASPRDLPPLALRLVVREDELERPDGSYDFGRLDARVASHAANPAVRIYLDLRTSGPPAEPAPSRDELVRAVATRYRDSVEGWVLGIPGSPRTDPKEAAFRLKRTAIEIRAGDPEALVILGGIVPADASRLAALYEEDLGAYVGTIGIDAAERSPALLEIAERHGAGVVLLGWPLDADPSRAREEFLEAELEVLGTPMSAVTFAAPAEAAGAILPAIRALRALLFPEVVALDDASLDVRMIRDGRTVTGEIPHRILFDASSANRYFLYRAREAPLELRLSEPTGIRPLLVDPARDERRPVPAFSWDPAARVATIGLPSHPTPLIVDWSGGERSGFMAGEDVSTRAIPSVAEILARHQQAQAAQEAVLRSYIVDAAMDVHFRPTAADPGFDIETENRFFVKGDETEWVELAFRINGTDWTADRPAFPLLQAEKVLSLPLELRLNADYRYELEGSETVGGRECWVLRFEPVDATRSLFRGRVWIDAGTWMRKKVETVQTALSAPIMTSEEVQLFAVVGELEGRPIQLAQNLVTRQTLLVAGRSILLEREVRFEDYELEPARFAERREAARASDRIMFRDTDRGLRYLVKRGGERVVQEETTLDAKAALVGLTYDPSYDYPLPIGGINYLDFDFLGEENQLALVFGGVLALVNVQRPNLWGERTDGSLDLFAIAIEGSDRVYDAAGEREGERVLTRPFYTAFNIGLRPAEFHRIVANYQFRYDHYSADEQTDPEFVPPSSTATHALGLSWEWKRAGWSFAAGGSTHHRAEWEPWGNPGDFRPEDRDYLRYSGSLSKTVYAGFQKVHLNAAYFGGEDLDRFSRYQFGLFDETRIHGVPSSGIRFGELGMFRGSWSLNLLDQYRLDLFLEQAFGREARSGSEWKPITGIGVGFHVRGPWNTLLRGDLGKSFLPPEYREPGSIVVQFQILKPL